jgi:hypothetical protein
MQIGAGYDIPLSSDSNKTQFVLSPLLFLFQPYFGQNPRCHRNLEYNYIELGVALKWTDKTFKKLQI